MPYTDCDAGQIKVGGELNRLASNVGFGRVDAGIHWRPDIVQGMLLGERVAISLPTDQGHLCNENYLRIHVHEIRRHQNYGVATPILHSGSSEARGTGDGHIPSSSPESSSILSVENRERCSICQSYDRWTAQRIKRHLENGNQ